jgi:hypothetical protein
MSCCNARLKGQQPLCPFCQVPLVGTHRPFRHFTAKHISDASPLNVNAPISLWPLLTLGLRCWPLPTNLIPTSTNMQLFCSVHHLSLNLFYMWTILELGLFPRPVRALSFCCISLRLYIPLAIIELAQVIMYITK